VGRLNRQVELEKEQQSRIRPVWYERLRAGGRNKPLLLKDIRAAVVAAEAEMLPRILDAFASDFPAQRPADERIVACIVGVP